MSTSRKTAKPSPVAEPFVFTVPALMLAVLLCAVAAVVANGSDTPQPGAESPAAWASLPASA